MYNKPSTKDIFLAAIYRFETLRILFDLEYPVDIKWLMNEYRLSLWNNESDSEDIEMSINLFILTYCRYIHNLDKKSDKPRDIGFCLPEYNLEDYSISIPPSIGSKLHLSVKLYGIDIKDSITLENPILLEDQEENCAVSILSNQEVSEECHSKAVEHLQNRFGGRRVYRMML